MLPTFLLPFAAVLATAATALPLAPQPVERIVPTLSCTIHPFSRASNFTGLATNISSELTALQIDGDSSEGGQLEKASVHGAREGTGGGAFGFEVCESSFQDTYVSSIFLTQMLRV
jgi:hypothetical protein